MGWGRGGEEEPPLQPSSAVLRIPDLQEDSPLSCLYQPSRGLEDYPFSIQLP